MVHRFTDPAPLSGVCSTPSSLITGITLMVVAQLGKRRVGIGWS